jgi:P27 family predicted phage terminase small subunit
VIPSCPSHLDAEAKKEWHRLSKDLYALGLLTKIDRDALAAYCQCYSRWVEAEQKLRETGMVVKAPTGYPMLNPYLSVIHKTLNHMQAFLGEFGLTPASRSRIHARPPEQKDDNKLARFIKKTP